MSGHIVPEDARRRQRLASDPSHSVWVSANAGAGKTKVLTDRVIRLLLAGSPPSRILCLTFTKAAAAEMTIRVFKTLGEWAALDDAALAATLEDLTGERPSPAMQARARRLFARAVETPGGLKIETIHAFCERILHLVPFEANVPPRFAVLDESQADELMAEARGRVLADAASRAPRFERLTAALETVASDTPGDRLLDLLRAAVCDDRIPEQGGLAAALRRVAGALGLRPGETAEAVKRAMLDGGFSADDRREIAAALRRSGKPTDASQAALLEATDAEATLDGRLAEYRSVFFTDKGTPRKSLCTGSVALAAREALAAEAERLEPLAERLLAAETVERTEALWTLASAIRARLVALKRRLGVLDFGDLIRKTLDLLEQGKTPWVLYRLDRGVDHVLIDEAQDTNPDQWRILRRLTEEFTAGAGRPTPNVRTVFAVGDPKQSIYSFQGADPRWFEDSRAHWQSRTKAAELGFAHVRLSLSFRSTAIVLKTVDQTFAHAAHYRGLSFEDGGAIGTTHEAVRRNAPGHIEIWPTQMRGDRAPDPDAWSLPVDSPDEESPAMRTAALIAAAVAGWTRPNGGGSPRWRPRDILILARKRGPAFFGAIRALKAAGVPVAGADRLDVGEHIAVNDLVAAGSAALLPDNDLALACALKSPLVGLDDDDLIRLAADRGERESLASSISRLAPSEPAAARAWAALSQWRELARREGPFGFYVTLLGPLGGRRQLVSRLGGEAADAIDAFLCYAQTAERGPEAPSLTTFLARFETAEHTIKRDLDASGDEVRVMTVHGAKGLEAPVVIVLDGCDVHGPDPKLIPLPVGRSGELLPVWSPRKDGHCRAVAAAREALKERALEEHNRLLYVAMTRARDWLVIAPFCGGQGKEPEDAWCAMIRRGFMDATCAVLRTETPHGPSLLWRDEPAPSEAGQDHDVPEHANHDRPAWLREPVPPDPEPAPPLSPSGALGAAERSDRARPSGRTRVAARRRGTLIHSLIEYLGSQPAAHRGEAASRWLASRAAGPGAGEAEDAVTAALAVLEHESLRPLFGPGSRGEVALAGRVALPGLPERTVSGQADRIAIGPDRVVVADFKTGAPGPDGTVPPSYLAQLALYRALLADLHPDKSVRALLVWTDGPLVVEPSPAELEAALARSLATLP